MPLVEFLSVSFVVKVAVYTKAITKILHKYSKSFQLQSSESELTN